MKFLLPARAVRNRINCGWLAYKPADCYAAQQQSRRYPENFTHPVSSGFGQQRSFCGSSSCSAAAVQAKSQEDDSENFWKVAADDSVFWGAYVSTRPNYSDAFYSKIFDHHAEHSKSWELAHDVGCGAGQVSAALAKRFKHVVASDINETHLAVAKSRLTTEFDASHVSFQHSTGENLHSHFPAQSADLVAAAEAIVLMDEHEALSSFHHILRPDGTLVLWFYGHPTFSDPQLRAAAQPLINAIMVHNWSKVIQGSGEKRKAGFKRAADGMASWLDYIPFDPSSWRDVQRLKWNTFGTLPFFGEAACGFPVDSVSNVRPNENVVTHNDPRWWQNDWDLAGLRKYFGVLFPGFKEAIGEGDQEVNRLFQELASKMDGEKTVKQFTWPTVLVLATKR